MLMTKNAYLLLAALAALPLQVQASSTSNPFTLSNLSVTSVLEVGMPLALTYSQRSVQTAEASRPDSISDSPHQITSVLTLAPTETKTGILTTTTRFDRTTTPYNPGSTPSTTFEAVVSTPTITDAVQRVRLFGSITSNLDVVQTLTFALVADGEYATYSEDNSMAEPSAPKMVYKFSNDAVTSFSNSSSPSIVYTTSTTSAYDEHATGLLTLTLQPHATKYFATKISTDGHSSITDYAITFTGATVSGTTGPSTTRSMASSYDTTVAMTVPEPASYAMLLAGLGVMGCIGRRSRKLAALAA